MSSIANLSLEVIVNILNYVYSAGSKEQKIRYRLVCKNWNRACDFLVTEIAIKTINDSVLDNQLPLFSKSIQNLWTVLERFRSLNSLDFNHCRDYGAYDFNNSAPVTQFTAIKHINLIFSIPQNEEFILRLARSCPHLESLHLQTVAPITKSTALVIRQMCPRLKRLSIPFSQTKEEGICCLAEKLSFIQIDLSGCFGITDLTVRAVAKNCLLSINLQFCDELTDCALDALAENCTQLVHLILASCKKFSRDKVCKLIQKNIQLEVLNLNYCAGITDHDLYFISTNCKFLKFLGIAGQHAITDFGVFTILRQNRQLEEIDFRETNQVSTKVISEIQTLRINKFIQYHS